MDRLAGKKTTQPTAGVKGVDRLAQPVVQATQTTQPNMSRVNQAVVLPTSTKGTKSTKKQPRMSRNFPGMKESAIERFVLNPLFGNASNFVVHSGQNIGEGLATLDPTVRKYANVPGVLGSSGQKRVRDVAAEAGRTALDLSSFATGGAGAALGATTKAPSLARGILQGAKVGGGYGLAAGATQALAGKQPLLSKESGKQVLTSGAIGAASGAALAGVLGGLSKIAANRAAKKVAGKEGQSIVSPNVFKDFQKQAADQVEFRAPGMGDLVRKTDLRGVTTVPEMEKRLLASLPDNAPDTARVAVRTWAKSAMGMIGQTQAILPAEAGKGIITKGVSLSDDTAKVADTSDPIARITQALKDAKPIRESQEKLYSKIRSERLGKALAMGQKVKGEKGFYAQLGALKGELPKAQFESLRKSVSQDDINKIMERLRTSPRLTGYKQITAQQAMLKLFAQEGGEVPTRSELSLLRTEFGDDFVKTVLEKRPLLQKLQEAGIQALNLPRAMMATGDFSAPLRQGVFMASKPKQFLPAFVNMFKYAGSEKAYKNLLDDIAKRPTYDLMEKNNLALTGMDDALTNREEAFISNWSEKVPLFGKLARSSNRAYSGFLNKVRADVFDDLVRQAQSQGVKFDDNPEVAKNIARLVNAGTGRGELPGAIAKHATALNGIFFSPRLMASRLQLMNPVFYAKLDPFTRKQALSMLVKAVGGAGSILALAKAGGAEVGADPRSADFGKIKLGNTRVDMLGGFQQYIKLAAQLMTGQVVSSTTGKVITLGEGYKPMTRLDIIGRFLESKEAPLPSFFTSLIRGQNSLGQQFNIPEEVASRFYPILWGDLKDLYNEQGPAMGTALTTLAMLGAGVQTYGPGMPGTTTSKEADKILAEAKYQPPEVSTSLTNPKNDEVKKLKGEDAKLYKKEIMDAVVTGISKARKNPRWQGLTQQEKYDEVKSKVSKEKKAVNEKWRQKVFGKSKEKTSLLNKVLGIKTANAGTLPPAKTNEQKLANQIATIEGYKKTGTLADRNNNPGNLRFVGQSGAVKGDRGFAKFKTKEEGFQALIKQIRLDAGRSLTLKQFIYKYAPPQENNTDAYLRSVSRTLGVSPNTKLKDVIK